MPKKASLKMMQPESPKEQKGCLENVQAPFLDFS